MLYVEVLILYCSLSVISVKLSPCAKWNKTGITVAGTGKPGNSNDQLKYPESIFIHNGTNTLYVADGDNMRIQMFLLDQLPTKGITVILTEAKPSKVYVKDDNGGPTIYVSLAFNSVKKWTQNESSGIQVGEDILFCDGLSVDREGNVYMADLNEHYVLKWSSQTNTTTAVAGQKGQAGVTDRDLKNPAGIYVDQNTGAVYIADFNNHRIQKWIKNETKGVTVAGSSHGMWGHDAASLYLPGAVVVDDETQIVYVADTSNNRIQKWLPDASEGETIAGSSCMFMFLLNSVSVKKIMDIEISIHSLVLTVLSCSRDQCSHVSLDDD